MDIAVELSRIIITETSPQQVIFLREKDGERSFPIVIGISEALAIDRRLKHVDLPRPMTHELLVKTIELLGGQLDKIVINDLRDHTFIATLFVAQGDEMIEIDARPSDAIAIGVGLETPMFVAEHVLEKVLNEAVDLSGQRETLQMRRDELAEQIVEVRKQLETMAHENAGKDDLKAVRTALDEMRMEMEAIEEILRHMPE
jgi:bifunctional DNase/RNase